MKATSYFPHLLILVCFMVFNSCSNGDDMEGSTASDEISGNETEEDIEIYFTLNVGEDYFFGGTPNWIVIHSPSGEVTDYGQIENGASYIFEKPSSEISNAFNITFIATSESNGNRSNMISTITLVGRGDVYNLTRSSQQNTGNPEGELVGNFDLNVQGLISPVSIQISNRGGPIGGGATLQTINGLTDYSANSLSLYSENRYLFSVYDNFGRGSYRFLEDITDGSDITFNRTLLTPFPSIVPVAIPENGEFFAQVLNFEENQNPGPGEGFISCLVFPFDSENFISNTFDLGYLPGFANYYTVFSFENEDFYYYFKKVGEKPIAITVPQGNFDTTVDVLDESLNQAFRYESPLDALSTRKSALWSTTSGTFGEDYVRTTWSILTGRNPFPITSDVPDEVLQSIPTLDIENLEYESMQFYISDVSYYNYLNAVFKENDRSFQDNLEYIRVDK
ncbi:MAG: hypothetical protein AAGH81_07585 [Bacteroidota bacterium]